MLSSMRRLAAGLVIAGALAMPVFAVHAAPSALTPKAYALTAADVPVGFKQTTAHFQSLSEAAGSNLKPKTLKAHGFVSSYLVSFGKGNQVIAANSYLFKSAADALWYDRFEATTDSRESGARTVTAPHLADPTNAYTGSSGSKKSAIVYYLVSVRHGALFVGVGVVGARGKVTLAQATHYAGILDTRMRALH